MNAKSVIAFLPIKPLYAKRLLSGKKKYEFRRNSIKHDLTHVIIYASSPIKKIIGVAEVQKVAVASPSATWEQSKQVAGISRKAFREYFQGKKQAYAIKIKRVIPFGKWIAPVEMDNGFKVPQSFSYVNSSFFDKVIKAGAVPDGW